MCQYVRRKRRFGGSVARAAATGGESAAGGSERREGCLRMRPAAAHCVRRVPQEVEQLLGAMKIVNEIGSNENHQQTCR